MKLIIEMKNKKHRLILRNDQNHDLQITVLNRAIKNLANIANAQVSVYTTCWRRQPNRPRFTTTKQQKHTKQILLLGEYLWISAILMHSAATRKNVCENEWILNGLTFVCTNSTWWGDKRGEIPVHINNPKLQFNDSDF